MDKYARRAQMCGRCRDELEALFPYSETVFSIENISHSTVKFNFREHLEMAVMFFSYLTILLSQELIVLVLSFSPSWICLTLAAQKLSAHFNHRYFILY